MSKKESVLSNREKESFIIDKFIFHIILNDEINPIYLDEIELAADQVNFFRERFIDVSEGVQHIFIDKEKSDFYKNCCDIIDDPEKKFIEISKKLAASFKSYHMGNTRDGVFITALVSVDETRQLIFLIKLDHRKVYEYTLSTSKRGMKALLHEIKRTFVEDKRAIQKSALIDVSDHYIWDVLATDRTAIGKLALRKYFADFLNVQERDTPASLTKKAISTVRQWAINNKILLHPEQDLSAYKNRAIGYLLGTAKFGTREFIKAVVQDEDDKREKALKTSLKSFCDEMGLTGQVFKPNENSINKTVKRNIRETVEGVRIEWEGDANDKNILFPNERNRNDNLYHIEILTSDYTIKDKDI